MNIWMVHPFAGGPDLGRHWRPYWLSKAWGNLGHRTTVVCATHHHLMQRGARKPGAELIGGVNFWFVKTPNYRTNGLRRLISNLSFGVQLEIDARKIALQYGEPDIVIASTPHLFYVSAASRIARRFDATFWIEVRDLWPESFIALGLAPSWHPLVKLISWQERHAYRVADRVISLLGGAEPHMQGRGLPAGRFDWIPNGVSELDILSAAKHSESNDPIARQISELKTKGKRIVVYAGGMGTPNAVSVIVDAAAYLSEVSPDVHFIMAGSGANESDLRQRASGLSNVEFIGEVERPVAHQIIRMADSTIMSVHGNALYNHGISPNKLFDYCLLAPRTVVACAAGAIAGLEDLATLRCEPDNPKILGDALLSALDTPERPLEQRIAAVRPFSYSQLAKRYLAGAE